MSVQTTRNAFARGFAALVLAILLRWVLNPIMGDTLPLVTLFGAVAAGVWLGGYRLAIPIVLVGYVACHYLFIVPRYTFHFANATNIVGLVAYLFTCTLIVVFGEAARNAESREQQRREVLRVTLQSIGDAVITTDTAGRITDLNEVAETLTGWTRDEALGQP